MTANKTRKGDMDSKSIKKSNSNVAPRLRAAMRRDAKEAIKQLPSSRPMITGILRQKRYGRLFVDDLSRVD